MYMQCKKHKYFRHVIHGWPNFYSPTPNFYSCTKFLFINTKFLFINTKFLFMHQIFIHQHQIFTHQHQIFTHAPNFYSCTKFYFMSSQTCTSCFCCYYVYTVKGNCFLTTTYIHYFSYTTFAALVPFG